MTLVLNPPAVCKWLVEESLAPSVRLHEAAFGMACALEHPVHDCLYLALAERERTRMVTADRAFVEPVARSPWKHRIESLGGA